VNSFIAPFSRGRWTYAGLALFVACLWLAVLPARPLFNPDEGRYAEIPREMLADGDWVIPHLDGFAYVEKPPLQYWATALSFRLFGPSVFAARLYTALAGLGGIAVIWFAARKLWNPDAGWRSAAVLASLSLYPVLGQLLTLDMSLTFYLTVALAGFLLAQRTVPPSLSQTMPQPVRHSARRYMLLAWTATAAGVLTKGLVAALIPVAVLILYTLISRDTAPWRRLNLSLGLPIFLGVTVPWHWLAAARLPDFLDFYFIHEHLARYLTTAADRQEAWWFFGAVLLAGSMPWTLSMLRVLVAGWLRRVPAAAELPPHGAAPAGARVPSTFNEGLFLRLWVVFVGVFFSLSDSKLIPYVLPAMPALALLIGSLPAAVLRGDARIAAILMLLAGIALAVAGACLPHWLSPSDRSPYFLALAKPAWQTAAVLAVSGGFVLAQRRREATTSLVLLGAGWSLGTVLLMRAAAAVAPIYSGVGLAAAISPMTPELPVYSVATYDQTLPFYLRRTVSVVAYRGELDYGLRHASAGGTIDLTEFLTRWADTPQAFAVMEQPMFDDLRARGVAMREVTRDAHRILVARP
jgi:4-amino-4-deoxy-L-arabinose transferase-like glycosyltransferase